MARKNIAREYFFGVATPVGYTKKGQLPQRRASEDGGSRLHSLQFRRSHVQLFVVLFLGFNFVGLFRDNSIATWILGASLLLPIILIRASIYSLADLPNEELDERESKISEASFAQSYRALFFLVLSGFIISASWRISLSAHQFFVVGISLLALIYVLPSAILAWTIKEA